MLQTRDVREKSSDRCVVIIDMFLLRFNVYARVIASCLLYKLQYYCILLVFVPHFLA